MRKALALALCVFAALLLMPLERSTISAVETAVPLSEEKPPAAAKECPVRTEGLKAETDRWELDFLPLAQAREFVAKQRDAGFLRSRARAERDLRAKGWKPVDFPTVVRFKDKYPQRRTTASRYGVVAQLRDWFVTPVHAQEYYYADSGEGYMAVWPWSDGNDQTFEANTYLQHNNGRNWDIDEQIWTDAEDWDFVDVTWAQGWRRGPGGQGPFPIRFGGGQSCPNGGCPCAGRAAECMLRAALRNSRNACAGIALGCRFAAEKWLPCLGGWCTAAFVTYLLNQADMHWDNCHGGC